MQQRILNVGCIPNFLILYGDRGLVMAGSWVFMSYSGDNVKKNQKTKQFSCFWYSKKAFILNQQRENLLRDATGGGVHLPPARVSKTSHRFGLFLGFHCANPGPWCYLRASLGVAFPHSRFCAARWSLLSCCPSVSYRPLCPRCFVVIVVWVFFPFFLDCCTCNVT